MISSMSAASSRRRPAASSAARPPSAGWTARMLPAPNEYSGRAPTPERLVAARAIGRCGGIKTSILKEEAPAEQAPLARRGFSLAIEVEPERRLVPAIRRTGLCRINIWRNRFAPDVAATRTAIVELDLALAAPPLARQDEARVKDLVLRSSENLEEHAAPEPIGLPRMGSQDLAVKPGAELGIRVSEQPPDLGVLLEPLSDLAAANRLTANVLPSVKRRAGDSPLRNPRRSMRSRRWAARRSAGFLWPAC